MGRKLSEYKQYTSHNVVEWCIVFHHVTGEECNWMFVLFFYKGRDVKCPDAQEIIYTNKERQYVEHIEKAYVYASKLLLNLLMEEKELMARLR